MRGGFRYSPVSYYTLGRVFPRRRLRETFPRRRNDPEIALFGPVVPPVNNPQGAMYADALQGAGSGAEAIQAGISGGNVVQAAYSGPDALQPGQF